ncbi:MAG TPA: DUF805 domain-containing protein [Ignavibacteria bacterium]
MNYYLKAFKNYFEFEGRANKSEFWYFVLFNILFSVTAMVVDRIFELKTPLFQSDSVSKIYSIIVFIPGLAVAVRRLHDVGKSGLYIFIVLIPVIGIIWFFVVVSSNGDAGENEYGIKPKEIK